MSEKIVVGTDGSESAKQALAEAMRLAKVLDAELHVVAAFEPARGIKVHAPPGAQKFYGSLSNEVARSIIDEAEATARTSGLKVERHMVQKGAADALLDVAKEVGASLIVVGSQGMSGARRMRGSVPNKVSHQATCNVLIVSTRKSPTD